MHLYVSLRRYECASLGLDKTILIIEERKPIITVLNYPARLEEQNFKGFSCKFEIYFNRTIGLGPLSRERKIQLDKEILDVNLSNGQFSLKLSCARSSQRNQEVSSLD